MEGILTVGGREGGREGRDRGRQDGRREGGWEEEKEKEEEEEEEEVGSEEKQNLHLGVRRKTEFHWSTAICEMLTFKKREILPNV